jgi:antitoxin VapB
VPISESMALNIRNAEADRLAARIAKLTGETKTEVVRRALEERLSRLERGRAGRRLADELNEIALHCASLPLLDRRSTEEILRYDDNGLPH